MTSHNGNRIEKGVTLADFTAADISPDDNMKKEYHYHKWALLLEEGRIIETLLYMARFFQCKDTGIEQLYEQHSHQDFLPNMEQHTIDQARKVLNDIKEHAERTTPIKVLEPYQTYLHFCKKRLKEFHKHKQQLKQKPIFDILYQFSYPGQQYPYKNS